MEALRLFARPVDRKLVIELPPGLDEGRLEVIVLRADEPAESGSTAAVRHQPSARLAGSVTLVDDLIEPASPADDWDANR